MPQRLQIEPLFHHDRSPHNKKEVSIREFNVDANNDDKENSVAAVSELLFYYCWFDCRAHQCIIDKTESHSKSKGQVHQAHIYLQVICGSLFLFRFSVGANNNTDEYGGLYQR